MNNLNIKYLGIELKNPIIIGASNLVDDPENLKKLEKAGASAIVFKSLFEEQIHLENLELHQTIEEYNDRAAEMTRLFPNMEHAGPQEYLMNLERAKKSLSIPVIGSLNAVYNETWVDFAKKIEATGVDALELNFYATPKDYETEGRELISDRIEILSDVKNSLSIPVSVKLSPFYTNILSVIKKMDDAGADSLVLFNNLFQPEIDIEKEEHTIVYNLSNENDNGLPLRFAGLLYKNINASICSNSGIYEGADVIKMLLAGADCVQVVSTIYKNGLDHIETMLEDISKWMKSKNYKSIDEFRGKLSKKTLKDPFTYKRAQYVDILMKSKEIFKKYPVI